MRATLHRLAALTVKESRQIRRDPSSIALAVLLPLLLLMIAAVFLLFLLTVFPGSVSVFFSLNT